MSKIKPIKQSIPDYVWEDWEKTRKEILQLLHKLNIDIPLACDELNYTKKPKKEGVF